MVLWGRIIFVQVNNNNNNNNNNNKVIIQFIIFERAGLTADMKRYLLAKFYNIYSLLLRSLG